MPKSRLTVAAVLEGVGFVLEAAVRLGLVAGSALAVAFGQFMLAAALAIVAVGMFVRLWRGRVSK